MAASHGGAEMDEFIPECELLFENGKSSEELNNECPKNPGHPNFIPVPDFKMEHLPPALRTQDIMNRVRILCKRTVKVLASYTSENRPETYLGSTVPYPYKDFRGSSRVRRCGTGLIENYEIPVRNKQCPCQECKISEQPKMNYWELVVITATHVVYDTAEASRTVFECFYDSKDRTGVKRLYGVRVLHLYFDDNDFTRYTSDLTQVTCVTHDEELIRDLFDKSIYFSERHNVPSKSCYGMLISHPHGLSKKITTGEVSDTKSSYVTYDIDTCPGSSGGAIDYFVWYSFDALNSFYFHSGVTIGDSKNRSTTIPLPLSTRYEQAKQ